VREDRREEEEDRLPKVNRRERQERKVGEKGKGDIFDRMPVSS
jgi:hypothetical protein